MGIAAQVGFVAAVVSGCALAGVVENSIYQIKMRLTLTFSPHQYTEKEINDHTASTKMSVPYVAFFFFRLTLYLFLLLSD